MLHHEYRVEMHVHTRFSHDSILPLWLLYAVCRLRKIDCIAITDHNEVEGALKFQQVFPKMSVIVGEEIFSAEGEIIGLYLSERIEPGLSASETIRRIYEQNGVVCIPHPADTKRDKTVLKSDALLVNLNRIHCIEKYNGRTLSHEDVEKQREIAKKTGLPSVIGSDAHTFYELGRNYNIFNVAVDKKEDFLSQLPNTEFHVAPCLSVAHFSTKLARGIKLVEAGKIHELIDKMIKH